jgi:hypothetical protein
MFKQSNFYRDKFGETINECVNLELRKKYELQAYTFVVYCDSTNKGFIENGKDYYEQLFSTLTYFIATLIVLSTIYDYYTNKLKTRTHYEQLPRSFKDQVLTSFSLPRNFIKLTSNTIENTEADSLRFVNGMKVLLVLAVIVGHTFLLTVVLPIENSEYFEDLHFKSSSKIILNGHIVVQFYFFVSAFLFALKFMEIQQQIKTVAYSFIFKGIFLRYLRLVPAYGYVILFNTSKLLYIQTGPYWRFIAESERSLCRENWWTNLLFVNNYVNITNPCVQQAWYLAAEFHLFIIALFLLIVINRHPKLTKPVFISSIGLSFLIPAIVTYYYRLEGVTISKPENMREATKTSVDYRVMYIPTHTNIANYVLGVVAGWIWFSAKMGKINIDRITVRIEVTLIFK